MSCAVSTFSCQKVPSKSLVKLINVYEVAAKMPDTESKGDFLMFRETLIELECLVEVRIKGKLVVRGPISSADRATTAIEDGIVHMLELLMEFDVNTSEANAIEELERLAEMRIAREHCADQYCVDYERGRPILDKMIDSKVNFIRNCSFGRVDSEDCVEPMAALERLAAVKSKAYSRYMDGLLEAKIHEIVWRSRVQASSRHDRIVRRRCY